MHAKTLSRVTKDSPHKMAIVVQSKRQKLHPLDTPQGYVMSRNQTLLLNRMDKCIVRPLWGG